MASASHSTAETTRHSTARLSSTWQNDSTFSNCHGCRAEFNARNRRHHCRLCGKIFCHDCSSRRSLVPPSSIVLIPKGGKKARVPNKNDNNPYRFSTEGFIPDEDPDRMLTYTTGDGTGGRDGYGFSPYRNSMGGADTLLYGRGLEERYKLAREPLRVCDSCFEQLRPIQEELRASNSNAVRYNSIDPTDVKRFFNSPLAFTLGHEIRKVSSFKCSMKKHSFLCIH